MSPCMVHVNFCTQLCAKLLVEFFFFSRFLEQAEPVLVRIRGVRLLWSEVEQLRAESYRQDNKEHEDMLLEVTTNQNTYQLA